MDYSKCTYISWHKYDESPEIKVYEGDILLVKTGSSYGKCALVSHLPKEATINPQFVVIKNISINPEYLTCVLQSEYARRLYEGFVLGTAIPTFTQEKLGNMLLPLPPIGEQKGIVATINEFNLHISNIENKKEELSDSIALSKSKILEFAMQGKLVPQDPTDEPAADMLRRINPRARIITDNPHSWNIPNTWTWCQLGDIFQHNTGKALNSSNRDGIEYEYITTSNVYWNRFELDDLKKMPFKKNELEKCTVRHGDLLVCEGGDVGRAAIWNLDRNIMIQNHLHRLRPIANEIHIPLYYHVFRHYKDKDLIGGKGIALQGFSSKSLHQLAIPLPPYNEQKRIVAKIEELYSVLDQIEASLQS